MVAPIEEKNHGCSKKLVMQYVHQSMSATSVNRDTGSESMGSAANNVKPEIFLSPYRYRYKESGINTNKRFSHAQTASQKNGFNVNEEPSKDVILFASSDDVKSGSTGTYCEADKPYKSQDHQVTLPHPVTS